MIELLSQIAGIIGGIAVLVPLAIYIWRRYTRWKNSPHLDERNATIVMPPSSAPSACGSHLLSAIEQELLRASADTGEIRILTSDITGDWVRCGQNTNYIDQSDPAFAAKYLEAFECLRKRGYLRHQGGILYMLTGTAFEIARSIKNAGDRPFTEPALSTKAIEILRVAASGNGNIAVFNHPNLRFVDASVNSPQHVRFEADTARGQAEYIAAIDELEELGLVKYEDGALWRVTTPGFQLADNMK